MWGASGLRAAIGGFRPPAETLPVTIGGPRAHLGFSKQARSVCFSWGTGFALASA